MNDMPNETPDTDRRMLRHTLATLAYRCGKAISNAPAGFDQYRAGDKTRTPGEILAHIGDRIAECCGTLSPLSPIAVAKLYRTRPLVSINIVPATRHAHPGRSSRTSAIVSPNVAAHSRHSRLSLWQSYIERARWFRSISCRRQDTHTRGDPRAHRRSYRRMLRHTLATLAYRCGKAISNAPAGFDQYRAGDKTRTPGEILAHIGDLFDWALCLAKGE